MNQNVADHAKQRLALQYRLNQVQIFGKNLQKLVILLETNKLFAVWFKSFWILIMSWFFSGYIFVNCAEKLRICGRIVRLGVCNFMSARNLFTRFWLASIKVYTWPALGHRRARCLAESSQAAYVELLMMVAVVRVVTCTRESPLADSKCSKLMRKQELRHRRKLQWAKHHLWLVLGRYWSSDDASAAKNFSVHWEATCIWSLGGVKAGDLEECMWLVRWWYACKILRNDNNVAFQ